MRKYSKEVSCDKRGQLVIPRQVRKELFIEEGTGFWVFLIENEGILLKKIEDEALDYTEPVLEELSAKSDKIGIQKKNIESSVDNYLNKEKGGFREI